MRIAVDASTFLDQYGGIRTYLYQLLTRIGRIDCDTEYLLHVARWSAFPDPAAVLPPAGPNFKPHFKRFPYRLLLNLEHRFGLRVEETLLLPKLDLYHGASQVLPVLKRTPSVLTLHHFTDMRHHPGSWEKFYYGTVYENSIRSAGRIITVSNFTKGFLLDRFKIPEERVTTIYHGIFDPKPVVTPEQLAALRSKYRLPGRFVVCVSRLNPGKNTVGLVRAFQAVAGKIPDLGLVLVGWPNPDYLASVNKTVAECGLSDRVVLTGPADDDEIPRFYAAAELFCFPSTSEGFGIPVIEAMAMGCPVAAAESTSIPEVAGGAALLFKPLDDAAMAEAMLAVLENGELRRGLIERGARRAAEFTWDKAARETLAVYKDAAG